MKIKDFVEKAIEGGWYAPGQLSFDYRNKTNDLISLHIYSILLDPLAWQAVGKVEGWDSQDAGFDLEAMAHGGVPATVGMKKDVWKAKMHRMIDALAEGKTLEQFIATL